MMRPTSSVSAIVLMALAGSCAAVEDSCLEHLGGGMSDVYCYIDQAKIADDQSLSIYKSLKDVIPRKSGYRKRFEHFLSIKDPGGYCEVVRGLNSGWGVDRNPKMSTRVGDVEYYECLYNASILRLKKIREMEKEFSIDKD